MFCFVFFYCIEEVLDAVEIQANVSSSVLLCFWSESPPTGYFC